MIGVPDTLAIIRWASSCSAIARSMYTAENFTLLSPCPRFSMIPEESESDPAPGYPAAAVLQFTLSVECDKSLAQSSDLQSPIHTQMNAVGNFQVGRRVGH